MAARNRPRAGVTKDDSADAHEERNMWNQIVADVKKLKQINAKAAEISTQIVDLEAAMARVDPETGKAIRPTMQQIDDLAQLYREGLRVAEEEQKILNEEPNDVIKNVGILQALRQASEIEPRNSQNPKSRNPKRQKLDTDGAADSPGPSPISVSTTNKLKTHSVRSGSVPLVKDFKEPKEPVVKIEEGSEGSKGPAGEKAGKFVVGAEVAYKQAKMKEDGSQWILCNIKSITDVGNKKRYEVQDPEPDSESGAPGQIYKTSAAALLAIPSPETPLPDYHIGKHVLACYPETTTFYRAEVTGMRKDVCRLRFEDDQNQEMEVGRRYVLDFSNK
ncbi:MAG: SAGA HAT/Core module component [Heterodermia speciosa]|uniref:SAGA HAT/Core module component n=1 Tax=Heterodermia speciosa TaxID=116794 RepID=A0A8H3ED69_9LECA|nr:MAG: SAGA HAT/Core module component [Heterodermia speciosa]